MSTCKFCNAEIEWIERLPHNLDHSRHFCQQPKQQQLQEQKKPTPRFCKFECDSLLLWDSNREGYMDVNTGLLHTKERCEEAKAKLELQKQGKNNHGSESFPVKPTPGPEFEANLSPYVDHTQPAKPLRHKTIVDPTPEGFDLKLDAFAASHKVRFSQYQLAPLLYTMVVWYEEGTA